MYAPSTIGRMRHITVTGHSPSGWPSSAASSARAGACAPCLTAAGPCRQSQSSCSVSEAKRGCSTAPIQMPRDTPSHPPERDMLGEHWRGGEGSSCRDPRRARAHILAASCVHVAQAPPDLDQDLPPHRTRQKGRTPVLVSSTASLVPSTVSLALEPPRMQPGPSQAAAHIR